MCGMTNRPTILFDHIARMLASYEFTCRQKCNTFNALDEIDAKILAAIRLDK